MAGLRIIATLGWLLGIQALAATITALATLADAETGSAALLAAAAAMGFVAAGVVLAFGGRLTSRRAGDGLIFVLLAWTVLPAFAALPFVFLTETSLVGSYFEAVSVFTTTGATALSPIEAVPRPLVLWRSVLEWLGGALTIVLAVSALERRDRAAQGGLIVMSAEIARTDRLLLSARSVLPLYAGLTVLCCGALAASGLPSFDAVCLALSTLSTGGAMPVDGDLSAYGLSFVAPVLTVFMIFGAANLVTVGALRSRRDRLVRRFDPTIIAIIAGVILVAILAVHTEAPENSILLALGDAVFVTVSLLSTTGFVYDSETAASLPLALVICAILVGGAYGSTAGGLKLERISRMMAASHRELRILVHPSSAVEATDAAGDGGDGERVLWSYLIAFLATVSVVSLILGWAGFDFASALLAATGAITNTGSTLQYANAASPGLSTHGDLSEPTMLMMSAAMVIGRVEILAVLTVLTRHFWLR